MTVVQIIRHDSAAFAALPAVIEGSCSWTHAKLWDRVDRLSAAFKELGVSPGRVLMAWLPNAHEAIEAELAALQSGLVWVGLNSRFTWGEAVEIIADCNPVLFLTDAEHWSRVEPVGFKRLCPGPVLLTGQAGPDPSLLSYEHVLAGNEPTRPDLRIDGESIARLRYSSGTTGRPKAAILPHRVYEASLRNLQAELHPLDSGDRVLHVAPLTHASGAMIFPILAAGGANVIQRQFDAAATLALIEQEHVTTMFLVPTLLQRLCAAPEFDRHDLSSLRTIVYGGAPMPVEKLARVVEQLGQTLVHIYGMTEAPYPITTLRREEHRPGNPRMGSIGKPTAVCEVRLVAEDGRVIPRDESGSVGEIHIRGRNVMHGYWRDEAETARALPDGWLASGDLARRDKDGFLWIVDRKKDMMISGGFNVYAKEVEEVLAAHPAVFEAAVVGLPHPDWGETVGAFVVRQRLDEQSQTQVPEDALLADELKSWCHERLAGYKCPRILRFVEDLPRNGAGKVMKSELRKIGVG